MSILKIGVLTFHRATNYGTVLQAFAMVMALRKLGNEAELIDYRPEYIERTMEARKLREAHSIKEAASIIAHKLIYGHQMSSRIENFDLFIKLIPSSSQVYYSSNELSTAIGQYDILISGSDQLWNERITGNDMAYFLPFLHPYKISYASSFGVSDISENRKKKINALLSDFSHISVREATAERIVQQILESVSNKKAVNLHRVVDPTLLLSSAEWCKFKSNDLKLPSNGYILTYYMIETPILRSITRKLQAETGLPVINLKPSKKQMILRQGLNMMWAGPAEFISCYASAKYVVTNSFHGTAFAINFEIPFYVAPLPISMAGEVNSRLIEILDWYELSDRFIDTQEKIHNVSAATMLRNLEKISNIRRNDSMQILSEMLHD